MSSSDLDKVIPLKVTLKAEEGKKQLELPLIPGHWRKLLSNDGQPLGGTSFQSLFDRQIFFELFPNATEEEITTSIDLIIDHLNSLSGKDLMIPDAVNDLIDLGETANKDVKILALEISKDRYINVAVSFQTDLPDVGTMLDLEKHAAAWMQEGMTLGLAFTFK